MGRFFSELRSMADGSAASVSSGSSKGKGGVSQLEQQGGGRSRNRMSGGGRNINIPTHKVSGGAEHELGTSVAQLKAAGSK